MCEMQAANLSEQNYIICNSIPIGIERESTQSAISQMESRVAEISEEINHVEHCLEAFRKHQDEANTFVAQRKSLLAPIRMVPDDLLCDILLLSQRFSKDKGFVAVQDRFTSVRVLTEVIANSAYKWDTVSIGWEVWNAISDRVPDHTCLKILKSLTLRKDKFPLSTHSFKSAPALAHFGLENIDYPFRKLLTFPWPQITHFCSRNNHLQVEELFSILNSMPKLSIFEFSGNTMIGPGAERRITLPNLQELKLFGHYDNLLDVIITLRLTTLGIIHDAVPSVLARFIRRSKCSLQELRFYGISLDATWNVEELQELKRLRIIWSSSLIKDLWYLTRKIEKPQKVLSKLTSWPDEDHDTHRIE
ncbi:hypothetical protein BDQ17DRAFT_1333149 [Cyathus striatus]|nr:hypothetical protein BDQ17DRAFT_1333149 [Cyathus striatus]